MADVHKFSERMIDMAERLEDVADAVQGRGNRRGGGIGTRWLVLPAAGAGLYALATNNSLGRHARGVIDQAKTRASELPEELLDRVRQTSGTQSSGNGNRRTPQSGSARKGSSRRRAGSSARKSSSSR